MFDFSQILDSYKDLNSNHNYNRRHNRSVIVDSIYIGKTSNKFILSLKNSNWLDVYNFELNDDAKLNFRSNLCMNIGFMARYKYLAFGYTANMNDIYSDEKLKSKKYEINVNANRVSTQIRYVHNRGGININEYSDNDTTITFDNTFDDLNSKYFTFDILYFFNNQKYSNSAAYNGSHSYHQIKNTGSWITGFSYALHDISFDFSKLAIENDYKNFENFEKQKNFASTICINIGYGYNYLISKNWLANITVIPSAGIKIDHESKGSNTLFTMKNNVKIALIYTKSFYYVGIDCQYHSNWYYENKYNLGYSIGTFNISGGIRF